MEAMSWFKDSSMITIKEYPEEIEHKKKWETNARMRGPVLTVWLKRILAVISNYLEQIPPSF